MKRNRHIGLKRSFGFDAGQGPRAMSADDLQQLGHARVSPLRALRLKCLGVGKTFTLTVRLCTAVGFPSWPFRMGKNPWSGPISDARREHGRRLGPEHAANRAGACSAKDDISAAGCDGGQVPGDALAEFSPTEKRNDEGDAS